MNIPFEIDISKPDQSQLIALQIVSILQGIRFGSIEIVIHDGRIVQIDKHEKFRANSKKAAH